MREKFLKIESEKKFPSSLEFDCKLYPCCIFHYHTSLKRLQVKYQHIATISNLNTFGIYTIRQNFKLQALHCLMNWTNDQTMISTKINQLSKAPFKSTWDINSFALKKKKREQYCFKMFPIFQPIEKEEKRAILFQNAADFSTKFDFQ